MKYSSDWLKSKETKPLLVVRLPAARSWSEPGPSLKQNVSYCVYSFFDVNWFRSWAKMSKEANKSHFDKAGVKAPRNAIGQVNDSHRLGVHRLCVKDAV